MKTQRSKAHEYRVLKEMDSDDTVQILAPSANRVYQVVDYEDDQLRNELASLDAGKLVALKIERTDTAANVWRAKWPASVESLIPNQ